MAAQQSVPWRLRRLGPQHITDHKDITNVFGSISWGALSEAHSSRMKEGEVSSEGQRCRMTAVCVVGPDGLFYASHRVSALQGDPWAVKTFARGIGIVVQAARGDYAKTGDPAADWCIVDTPCRRGQLRDGSLFPRARR
eukprot:7254855-Pyramimonas_sp.AAC.1